METLGAGPSYYQFHDTEWIRCLTSCPQGSNRVCSEGERQDRKKTLLVVVLVIIIKTIIIILTIIIIRIDNFVYSKCSNKI